MHRSALDFIALVKANVSDERVKADLILDTNVVAELYSIADVLREVHRCGPVAALGDAKFLYRAHRAKHTYVLAWWLRKQGVPAAFLGAEQINVVVGNLAPDTDLLSFCMTKSFVHIIRDLVLGGWHLGTLIDVDHHKLKDAADDEILRIAAAENDRVVTWEGYQEDGTYSADPHKLRNRCRTAGIDVQTPEEYLANEGVDVDAEAKEFLHACDDASWNAQWENVLQGRKDVDLLVGFYRLVILREIDPYLRGYFRL